ncbi:transcriptional regulator [Pseudomonas nabeulensis]|uniref:Transcriptional regulator n=2 Tax=Pseudomonas TaxID=286 RepID=A0A4Z0B803_9PSED|nr:transcriptional regulator [Pseudomonas nabeulensis]
MSRTRLENCAEAASSTTDRLLHLLKTRGPQQAADAGRVLSMTAEAARQQFNKLASSGLVEAYTQARGVGRPSQFWKLTEAGHSRFPDTHSELTIQLLDTVRQAFGEQAIDRLIDMREQKSREWYLHEMSDAHDLKERVKRLAQLRSREGYMAEYEELDDGTLLFIENHCPICAAATACQGFCRAELMVFEQVLRARVERIEHIISNARRCAYKITPL